MDEIKKMLEMLEESGLVEVSNYHAVDVSFTRHQKNEINTDPQIESTIHLFGHPAGFKENQYASLKCGEGKTFAIALSDLQQEIKKFLAHWHE